MKKYLSLTLAITMSLVLFTGCIGTTVVIGECNHTDIGVTTPAEPSTPSTPNTPTNPPVSTTPESPSGSTKTGLSVSTTVSDSTPAADGQEGCIKYDITLAAVTVDDAGMIQSCVIDSIPASVSFDAAGNIVSDVTAAVPTKNEMGADYGMVAWGGAKAEWNEQVAALASYAIGKTVDELKNGAIDESGKAPEGSDLASSASIYLGGYVSAIEAAVSNAQHLGAQSGDTLALVTMNELKSSTSAAADQDGNSQLDASIAVVTHRDGVITSCYLDAVQAKIAFNASGEITSDLTAAISTKNEMGADYGMVAWGGAKAEWNEQAAAFAEYVTGKTADEVAGIAITETTKPADGSDLASSVTISVGGFQSLIAKALTE
ncbi:MAG: hypothetical protein IKC03_05790 [Oscillospiraceae bacterium]|nr:hypothetical protein [Oscillospiraceae bacterium]